VSNVEDAVLCLIHFDRWLSKQDPFDLVVLWRLSRGATLKEIGESAGITKQAIGQRAIRLRKDLSNALYS